MSTSCPASWRQAYGGDHRTTVLVYAFEKPRGATDATVLERGTLLAMTHLQQAGLYDHLTN